MKLVLAGLENPVEIESGFATTLQVENEALFARIARSILSLQGREALEPFTLWEEDGEIRPASALIVVSDVLHLPWDDRALMGEVLNRIEREFLEDEDLRRVVESMDVMLSARLLQLGLAMNSDYAFGLQWNLRRYLKFRGFGIGSGEDESLLDNLMNFLSLALDAGCKKVIVFVNLKTFLTKNELVVLFNHIFSSNMKILLLENKHDDNEYESERKIVIDLDFIEQ